MVDYTQRYFNDSVSWPLLLILFGFIVLLFGVVFAKLSGRIKEQSAANAVES
jgi:hypothetical protein